MSLPNRPRREEKNQVLKIRMKGRHHCPPFRNKTDHKGIVT